MQYELVYPDGKRSRMHTDIGFPRGYNPKPMGGFASWELRMESAPRLNPDGSTYQYKSKISTPAKEPTYFMRGNGSSPINIFEGFFNMMSYVEQMKLRGKDTNSVDFVVLNSIVFADKVIEKLSGMDLSERHISLFLDNDVSGAGNKCTRQLIEGLQGRAKSVTDQRGFYKGYNDLNDWHVASVQGMVAGMNEQQYVQFMQYMSQKPYTPQPVAQCALAHNASMEVVDSLLPNGSLQQMNFLRQRAEIRKDECNAYKHKKGMKL